MAIKRSILLSMFFLDALIVPAHAAVEPKLKEFLRAPFELALTGYQRYVSPIKGTVCPMEPNDSTFARQALQKKGLFIGLLATADRLHRCGHDPEMYEKVSTDRGMRLWDPVSESDR